jgi:hypothetical protein
MLKKHGITTREQAAALVHTSARAWLNWCAPVDSPKHRQMPLAVWELLLIKLGEHPDYKNTNE